MKNQWCSLFFHPIDCSMTCHPLASSESSRKLTSFYTFKWRHYLGSMEKTSRETDWYGEISRGSIDLFIPIYTQHLIDCRVELEARQKLSKEDWNWAPPKVAVRSKWKFVRLWLLIYRSIYEKLLDFILVHSCSVTRAVYNSLISQIKSNKIILLLYFAEGSNVVKSRSSKNMVRCRKKQWVEIWVSFDLTLLCVRIIEKFYCSLTSSLSLFTPHRRPISLRFHVSCLIFGSGYKKLVS